MPTVRKVVLVFLSFSETRESAIMGTEGLTQHKESSWGACECLLLAAGCC